MLVITDLSEYSTFNCGFRIADFEITFTRPCPFVTMLRLFFVVPEGSQEVPFNPQPKIRIPQSHG
jgi:hypothetical protein